MLFRSSAPDVARADALLGPPPLGRLAPFERRAFVLVDTLYRRAHGLTEAWLSHVSRRWMLAASFNMVIVRGLERLAGVRPTDRILLVSNHRSFFDLYMLGVHLRRHTELHQPLLCPVRGDFFYEEPLGVLVNLLVGGGRMFPPFFRDPAKADFNKWALARLALVLREGPPVIVGFHPEGRRSRDPDPYKPLPAQPGVGKLVMDSWPVVVPAFINGMSSDFIADVISNFTGDRRCVAVFGAPVDLSSFRGASNRLASHKKIADRLLEIIFTLGEEERAVRRELGLSR